MKNKLYDILIVGAGPAGMTAAIYAGRAGKTVALVEKITLGGNIAKSNLIENIPGFTCISGTDFSNNLYDQISENKNIELVFGEVVLVNYLHGIFKVSLEDGVILNCLSLIIATGTKHKTLNFNTEDTYYCATCDGAFFKNKPVIVIGSGNTGVTYALDLATICSKVYICDLTAELMCEKILKDRLLSTENIEWIPNCTVVDTINIMNKLSTVILSNNTQIECNAIFVAIGQVPQTNFIKSFVKLDNNNYIISSDCTIENVPGLFVAGDCRNSKFKQVTTATADGTIAALEAIKYINALNQNNKN